MATSDGEHPLRARRDRRGDPLGYGDERPARAGSARRRLRPRVRRTHGAVAGVPLDALLPRAPARHRERPGRRRGAAGRQPLGRHPLRRRDAAARHPPRPPAPPPRAPAGCQLRLSLGLDGQRRCARRLRSRVDGDRVADAGARRAGRRVPRRSAAASASCIASAIGWRASAAAASSASRARPRCRCCRSPIVGAEEIHPVIGKITRFAEPLGIPYIPITPTFPWLGPLGLLPVPTKWTIQIGTPIAPPQPGDEDGTPRVAEEVRSAIDGMIADLLAQRRSILFG